MPVSMGLPPTPPLSSCAGLGTIILQSFLSLSLTHTHSHTHTSCLSLGFSLSLSLFIAHHALTLKSQLSPSLFLSLCGFDALTFCA